MFQNSLWKNVERLTYVVVVVGGSNDNTALAMNVGKTTVHEAFRDVVNALYDIRNAFIKLPVTVDETAASIGTFEHLSMPPNIAGAIDGSHIIKVLCE